jgi:regulator of cell morphogenesis and NO signaling
MDIGADSKIGDLAAELPGAARVFMRHGIEFCCGGQQTLAAACEAAGVPLERLAGELTEAKSEAPDDTSGWSERSLSELIDHILDQYHRPLRQLLPHLVGRADHVAMVHGEQPQLQEVAGVVTRLAHELQLHMAKEENVLFPWIRSGQGANAHGPVRVMLMEHQDAAHALRELHELTGGFASPPGACPTWRTLYAQLAELNESMRRHMHLENNILFPRTLAGEV